MNRYPQTVGRPYYLPPGPPEHVQNQAKLLQDRRDPDGAMAVHKRAERLCRKLGNKEGLSYSLGSQALILQRRGDLDRAMALHKEAENLYGELGNRDGVALSLRNQAKLLQERRDLGRALELLALIFFALRAEAQQLNFVPFNSSGIYRLGEKARWTVSPAQGEAAPVTKYPYEIKKNNLDRINSGTLCFVSGRATIEATLEEPAMLYVTVSAEGATPASAVHLGAAIAPAQLRPSVPRPADFDSFWDSKLQALSLIPLNPVATPVATREDVELLRIQVDGWGSRAHGYLAKPAKQGKFPALVIFQYAGVYALRPSTVINPATEGWLAFDVVSHDLPPEQAVGASCNYEAIGNTNRETSYFLKMYLRDARALDYITSHPDWDGKTLVLMGTCMGGQQALVSAGLCPQVTAVIANQPSGADSNGDLHGRKAGYPYWPSHDPKVMETALYFDIVNFAPRIKAPVLASIGFIDTTSPPVGIWTVLNQIPGPKEVVTMIELDHTSRTPEKRGAFRSRAAEVLDILLHGGQFRPNQ